ncbi:MAG: transaldolase [Bacteroidales bacterium]|nr:transaldolase [Bacteroidales bacterium]
MKSNTKQLSEKGQSIWLDNITRKMIDDGTLKGYIDDLSVTGLTSNPSIFDSAIAKTGYYDSGIAKAGSRDITDEELFFSLAIEDIQRAADLFMPVYKKTNGLDGFVSIEVSPLLAYDTENTIKAAKDIFRKVNRPNTFIKIPGTPEGLPAIEAAIAEGIPVNVTLLFSTDQYIAASRAYLRGIETRIERGVNADIRSVASVFVSRWDKAVADKVPTELNNRLGMAIMGGVLAAYHEFLASDRVRRIMNEGAIPQRLLWASTGTKDPNAPDTFYIEKLIAPFTVNTIPESTLLAFADHGKAGEIMKVDTAASDKEVSLFSDAGIDSSTLGSQLQKEGAEAFISSWEHLIESIGEKRKSV